MYSGELRGRMATPERGQQQRAAKGWADAALSRPSWPAGRPSSRPGSRAGSRPASPPRTPRSPTRRDPREFIMGRLPGAPPPALDGGDVLGSARWEELELDVGELEGVVTAADVIQRRAVDARRSQAYEMHLDRARSRSPDRRSRSRSPVSVRTGSGFSGAGAGAGAGAAAAGGGRRGDAASLASPHGLRRLVRGTGGAAPGAAGSAKRVLSLLRVKYNAMTPATRQYMYNALSKAERVLNVLAVKRKASSFTWWKCATQFLRLGGAAARDGALPQAAEHALSRAHSQRRALRRAVGHIAWRDLAHALTQWCRAVQLKTGRAAERERRLRRAVARIARGGLVRALVRWRAATAATRALLEGRRALLRRAALRLASQGLRRGFSRWRWLTARAAVAELERRRGQLAALQPRLCRRALVRLLDGARARALRQWREWARAAARGAARAGRARYICRRALRTALHRRLCEGFRTWVAAVRGAARRRATALSLAARLHHRLAGVGFRTWVAATAAAVAAERRRGARAVAARRVLVRLARREQLRALRTWRAEAAGAAEAATEAERRCVLLRRALGRLARRELAAGFAKLRWLARVRAAEETSERRARQVNAAAALAAVAASRQRSALLLGRALARMSHAAQARALGQWRAAVELARRQRASLRRAFARMVHARLAAGFSGLAAHAREHRRARRRDRIAQVLLLRTRRAGAERCLAAWRVYSRGARARRGEFGRVLRRWARASERARLARALERLRAHALAERREARAERVLARAAARMRSARASRAWRSWLDCVAAHKRLRELTRRALQGSLRTAFAAWRTEAHEGAVGRAAKAAFLRRRCGLILARAVLWSWREVRDAKRRLFSTAARAWALSAQRDAFRRLRLAGEQAAKQHAVCEALGARSERVGRARLLAASLGRWRRDALAARMGKRALQRGAARALRALRVHAKTTRALRRHSGWRGRQLLARAFRAWRQRWALRAAAAGMARRLLRADVRLALVDWARAARAQRRQRERRGAALALWRSVGERLTAARLRRGFVRLAAPTRMRSALRGLALGAGRARERRLRGAFQRLAANASAGAGQALRRVARKSARGERAALRELRRCKASLALAQKTCEGLREKVARLPGRPRPGTYREKLAEERFYERRGWSEVAAAAAAGLRADTGSSSNNNDTPLPRSPKMHSESPFARRAWSALQPRRGRGTKPHWDLDGRDETPEAQLALLVLDRSRSRSASPERKPTKPAHGRRGAELRDSDLLISSPSSEEDERDLGELLLEESLEKLQDSLLTEAAQLSNSFRNVSQAARVSKGSGGGGGGSKEASK